MEDDPKTEASMRTLPMDDEMVEVLRRAHRRQAADRLQLGVAYRDDGYVACNEDGTPYHPDTLTHRCAKAVEKAGARHIRSHDARHTCGTAMHLRKVPLAVICLAGARRRQCHGEDLHHSQDEALRAAARTSGEVVSSRVIEAG
ncbi:tyrosine-type recombinase/integrase [Nocardia asteroides]